MKRQWRVIAFLSVVVLIPRLFFLTSLPIFNDEAMYLHWGLELRKDLSAWILPIVIDGKQPGVAVLTAIATVTPIDPLIAGRLLSIFFSLLTYLSYISIYKVLYPKRSLFLPTLLFSFCPFLLFFDRMILAESALTAFVTAALFLTIKQQKKPTVLRSILLGLGLAAGWWIKSTMLLAAIAFFVVKAAQTLHRIHRANKFPELKLLQFREFALTLGVFFLLIAPLLFHPLFHVISARETERALSIVELLHFPVSLWLLNLSKATQWFLMWLTPLGLLATIVGGYTISKEAIRNKHFSLLPLLAWLLIPLVIEIFVSKIFTSRYLVIVLPPLLILMNEGVWWFWHRARTIAVVTIAMNVMVSVALVASPLLFYTFTRPLPLAHDDFSQYVTNWASGWGVREAAEFVKKESQNKTAYVFVRLDSGNPEDAMYVYLARVANINVLPIQYLQTLRSTQTFQVPNPPILFFISRGPQLAGLEKNLTELKRFYKPFDKAQGEPGEAEFVGVYEVNQ